MKNIKEMCDVVFCFFMVYSFLGLSDFYVFFLDDLKVCGDKCLWYYYVGKDK